MSTQRMDPGELQMVREYLGLTLESLARLLSVNPRTVRSWEAGRDKIPERIRVAVERIEADTAIAVGQIVEALNNQRDPAIEVYRTDEAFQAARAETAHLSARWWRHVVARAVHEVPGVVIVSTGQPPEDDEPIGEEEP